ncbi:MAG: hypothetical protein EOP06_31070 [Proteobacteria bacterium]|nr:MAG: hypothetical protein EOP06_31070 [Pseudomonadota bacterium]
MKPSNMSTIEFLALGAFPPAAPVFVQNPTMLVKVYDYANWRWVEATDAELIALAKAAATPKLGVWHKVGETLHVADIYINETKYRVMVEAS